MSTAGLRGRFILISFVGPDAPARVRQLAAADLGPEVTKILVPLGADFFRALGEGARCARGGFWGVVIGTDMGCPGASVRFRGMVIYAFVNVKIDQLTICHLQERRPQLARSRKFFLPFAL